MVRTITPMLHTRRASIKETQPAVRRPPLQKAGSADRTPESAVTAHVGNGVCYGDDICLYCEDCDGYIFSHQSGSAENALNIFNDQKETQPSGVPHPYSIQFTIYARNRYKQTKAKQKTVAQAIKFPHDAAIQARAKVAEEGAEEEAADNEAEQQRQLGKKLRYGQIVQLRHKFTGKFIHISTTQTSLQDKNNMMVFLDKSNGKTAQFKIIPRFKVKAEGDVVNIDDQVVLESIKTPGQYLHASAPWAVSQLLTGSELNLGVYRSGFTVVRARPASSTRPDLLRAGTLIRFLHREIDAYLVATGIFNRGVTENVHMRVRKATSSSLGPPYPSSSAITYWVVEAEAGITYGDVIHWGQHVRIRHMTTLQYLQVQANGAMSMTTDNNDALTVFRLHPVNETMKEVELESYTRLQHVITGKWVHADKDALYIRKELHGSERQSVREKLRWDTATLKRVTGVDESMYDDAFTIQHVTEELSEHYRFVAGMVQGAQNMALCAKDRIPLPVKRMTAAIKSLEELAEFMIHQGSASKRRQKLLRNLGVVDLLVDVLKYQQEPVGNPDLVERVNAMAYEVIETYLKGDSRKNELYICKYIEFFTKQFSLNNELGQRATTMMTELIRDNRKVLDRLTKTEIKSFVRLVKKTMNYRFLDLLGVLCVCDGVSLPDNQTFIAQCWLADSQEGVLLTEVGNRINMDPDTVYVSKDGESWQPIHTFCGKPGPNRMHTSGDYLFLEAQLDLFGKLCMGRNDFCIRMITEQMGYLTWGEAFICLQDERLPDALRAKYCDLITGMFVDVGENRSVLDQMNLSFIYEDVGRGDILKKHVANMPRDTLTIFPSLRDWLNDFFDANKDMTASERGKNQLIEQVLRLLHHLVTYGYYSEVNDIQKLLTPLLSLLDGTNDKPQLFPGTSHGSTVRYKGRQVDVDDLRSAYQKTDRFKKSPETKDIVNAKYRAMEVVDLIMEIQHNIRLEKFLALYKKASRGGKQARQAVSDLRDMMSSTAFFKENVTDILLDLTNYDYSKMVVKAMGLLNQHYSAYHSLFTDAVQAQVLVTESSVDVHRRVLAGLPLLRRLLTVQTSDDQVEEVCKTLQNFTSLCHLVGEPDEAHAMNQTILVNNGVLDIIFSLLSRKLDTELEVQYRASKEVLESTLELLKALIKDNKHVQTRAFDNFDFLIDLRGVEAKLGEALLEIFTGNQETCLRVQSHQIQAVMQRIANLKEKASEFLDLLCAIVKVEEKDLPLKRNQTYVMRALMTNYHGVGHILEKPREHRQQILRNETDPEIMSYLISFIDLLASCSEGENPYIESRCQTILPVDEVIETLNDPHVDNNLKRPYLRFLLWAYLNTGVPALESGILDLPEKILPWKHQLAQDVMAVTEWVKNNQDETTKLLKKAPPKRAAKNDKDTSAVSQSKTDQMYATLHFLFDAALPFLKVYYRKTFVRKSRTQSQLTEELTRSLIEFSDAVAPLVSSSTHMTTLTEATIALLAESKTDEEKRLQMDETKKAFLRTHGSGELKNILSQAQEKYADDYKEERRLNHEVNEFARRMEKLYKRENKATEQIGAPSVNTREYCDRSGAKSLPLGNEFQLMVKRFIDLDVEPKKKYHRTKKLIQQLHISCTKLKPKEQASARQVSLDIKCLQVLRGLIHNQERHLPTDPAKQKKDKYQIYVKEIQRIQADLNEHDAIIRTIPLLSRPQRELAGQYLSFLSAMFLNANLTSQEALETYFLGTREELFFHTVKKMLDGSIMATKERRLLDAQEKTRLQEAAHQKDTILATLGMKTGQDDSTGKKIEQEGKKLKKEALMSDGIALALRVGTGGSREALGVDNSPDEFNVHLILETLAFMCDGQNQVLQDYLREQPDNIKTINIVGEVVDYLNLIYSRIDSTNVDLVTQLLSTLNEFCSGNPRNHQVVFDHELIDYLNFIIRQPELVGVSEKDVMELHDVIANLIMSMIEENHLKPKRAKLLIELSDSMDMMNIRRIAVFYHKEAKHPQKGKHVSEKTKEEMLKVGFKFHFIFERLVDINPSFTFRSKQVDPSLKAAIADYNENTMSVEVVTDNGLQRIRFRVRDEKALRSEVKEKLKWSIDRSSPSNKLRDLLDWSKDIIDDIDYQRKIRKMRVVDFLIRNWNPWNNLVIALSLFINIFMVATWDSRGALGKTELPTALPAPEQLADINSPIPVIPNWYNYMLWPAGIIHNILSIVVIVTFFLSNRPAKPSREVFVDWWRSKFSRNYVPKPRRQSHLRPNLISFLTLYYVMFVILSIFGTIFYGYFFAFHLLNIVYNNNLLQRVCRAVTQNGKSLLWVGVLGLFVLYIFTLVAFGLLRTSLDPEGEQPLYCITLGQCLVTVIRFGLLGELFEFMKPHELTLDFPHFGVVAIYHILFFIVITTIGLNIVFGIILDTFSELRATKWETEKDMRGNCFICNRSSFEFERQAKVSKATLAEEGFSSGFKYHVEREHNMWAYMFLLINLREKAKNDYTNIELQVSAQVAEQKLDFFPIGQALSLTSMEDDWTQAQLTDILEKLNRLINKQEQQESEKQLQREMDRQADWEERHREEALRAMEDAVEPATRVPFRGALLATSGLALSPPPPSPRASHRFSDEDPLGPADGP